MNATHENRRCPTTNQTIGLIAGVSLAAFLTNQALANPAATGVRVWDHQTYTRIVIDMDDAADYVIRVDDIGNIVTIGFPSVSWQVPNVRPTGFVAGSHYLPLGTGGEFSLRTDEPAKIAKSFYLSPDSYGGHRIVIDLAVDTTVRPVVPIAASAQPSPLIATETLSVTVPSQIPIEPETIDSIPVAEPAPEMAQIPKQTWPDSDRDLGPEAGPNAGSPAQPTGPFDDLRLGRAFIERGSQGRPAVSGVNGKIDLQGGDVDDSKDGLFAGTASVTVPLGKSFGAQADGLIGEYDDDSIYAAGGHLFWRDPARALAGATGAWYEFEDVNVFRVGGEAEMYAGPMTFAANGGWQGGDVNNTLYAGADGRYYWTENFMTEAGVSGYSGRRFWHIGGEWHLGWGLSAFADGSMGNDDYEHIIGGLRIYLSPQNKSLIQRHREDDPTNPLLGGAATLVPAAKAQSAQNAINALR